MAQSSGVPVNRVVLGRGGIRNGIHMVYRCELARHNFAASKDMLPRLPTKQGSSSIIVLDFAEILPNYFPKWAIVLADE